MSNALKCPNPGCPYLFDPTGVPAGVVLTCPRCAMRFTLGPPPPAPDVPAAAAPPPGYPPAPPFPPPDDFSGMSATEAEPAADGGAPRLRPPPAHRGLGLAQTLVLVGGALAMLAVVGVMVYVKVFRTKDAPGGTDLTAQLKEHNLSFERPGAPWAQDDDTRVKLGSPVRVVYARADPEAYMAFGVRDFDTRAPRPSELRDGLTGPLNKLFDDVKTKEIEGGTWLGRPAVGFEFLGRSKQNGPNVAGECLAVAHQGIAYWSICWASEKDTKDQLATFDATRAKFKLLGLRDRWVAKEAPVRAIGGHAAEYQVLDAEGIWAEPDPKADKPTEYDPKADLLLRARLKTKGSDRAREATLVAVLLDPAGGAPLDQAQKYVEDRRAAEVKESGLTAKFTVLTGEPEGDPTPNTVEPTAPVVRVQEGIPGARGQSRLMVVSALAVGKKVVAVYAWCAFDERAAFESKLIQIAGSLREAN